MNRVLSLLTITVAAGACGVLDPTFAAPATLIFSAHDTAQITAPVSVAGGAAFDVTVQTIGGGCTRAVARTDRSIAGRLVEIRPYNETRRSDVCTRDLRYLTHRVMLQFADPGAVTIRIIGQEGQSLSGGDGNRTVQLERIVTVTP